MGKRGKGITGANGKPKFDPMSDPRRAAVLAEYQNQATSAKRRKAIDAKWGFSKDPSIPRPKDEYTQLFEDLVKQQQNSTFVDQTTPQGQLTYQQNPDGTWSQTVTLNPQDQARLDWQRDTLAGLQGNIDAAIKDPLNFDDLGKVPMAEDFAADRDRIEAALMDRAHRELDPEFDQERAALEQHLASSGIPRGSEQFDKEVEKFDLNKMRTYAEARDRAVAQGQTEQANLFNRALTSRQQAINERLTKRSQPMQEYAGILGFDSGLKTPEFPDVPQFDLVTPGINIFGIKKGQEQAAAERALSEQLAREQNKTQLEAARIAAAAAGGGGGGGMSLEEQLAIIEAEKEAQIAIDAAAAGNKPDKPGFADAAAGIAGSAAGGFAQGFGQSWGASLGKSGNGILGKKSGTTNPAPSRTGKGLLGLGNARLSGFR